MTYLNRRNKTRSLIVAGLLALTCWGCSTHNNSDSRIRRIYHNPFPHQRSLAIAPFQNQSGSGYLEVMAVTDEFYSELQLIDGLQVVAINRVLTAMNNLGINQISSPEDALALPDELEVNGVIVGAVTQYDPYPPPKMGMAVQLYIREQVKASRERIDSMHINPGEMARSGRMVKLSNSPGVKPRAAVVRIIDADQEKVIERIKLYAADRTGNTSPTGWKTYLTSRKYLRFAAHEIIGEMLAQEQQWIKAQKLGEEQ